MKAIPRRKMWSTSPSRHFASSYRRRSWSRSWHARPHPMPKPQAPRSAKQRKLHLDRNRARKRRTALSRSLSLLWVRPTLPRWSIELRSTSAPTFRSRFGALMRQTQCSPNHQIYHLRSGCCPVEPRLCEDIVDTIRIILESKPRKPTISAKDALNTSTHLCFFVRAPAGKIFMKESFMRQRKWMRRSR